MKNIRMLAAIGGLVLVLSSGQFFAMSGSKLAQVKAEIEAKIAAGTPASFTAAEDLVQELQAAGETKLAEYYEGAIGIAQATIAKVGAVASEKSILKRLQVIADHWDAVFPHNKMTRDVDNMIKDVQGLINDIQRIESALVARRVPGLKAVGQNNAGDITQEAINYIALKP